MSFIHEECRGEVVEIWVEENVFVELYPKGSWFLRTSSYLYCNKCKREVGSKELFWPEPLPMTEEARQSIQRMRRENPWLFKKYGEMPDGFSMDDIPTLTREELNRVLREIDGSE